MKFADFHAGQVLEAGPHVVDEAAIVAFARDYDPQWFHVDPEGAQHGPFDGLIASAKVTLDITHTYIGDLRVTLLTPWGDAIRLHDRTGSNADNIQRSYDEAMLPALATLRSRRTQGDWRLQVQDLAAADAGRLNRWALEFTISSAPSQVVPAR